MVPNGNNYRNVMLTGDYNLVQPKTQKVCRISFFECIIKLNVIYKQIYLKIAKDLCSQYYSFDFIFLCKSMALQWVVNSTELSKKCKQKTIFMKLIFVIKVKYISSSFLFNALCHATSNLSVYTLIYDISRHTMCNLKPL